MTFLPMENIQLPCFNVDPVTGPNYGFNSSNPSQEVITDPTDLPGHQRKKTRQHNIPDKEHNSLTNTKSSISENPPYQPSLDELSGFNTSRLRHGQFCQSWTALTWSGPGPPSLATL